MDDHDMVLSMEFIDRVKTVPISFTNTMCIMEKGELKMTPLTRRRPKHGATLSAMQLNKGIKRGEFTFRASIKEDVREIIVDVPKEIASVLNKFHDFMPPKLPMKLPPKREVDHEMKLVPRARPPAPIPYHMSPSELEVLRR